MNKQVAVFLYYFLRDAALPEKFLMEILCKTCDSTLIAEIHDCNWDTEMQTITTPCKKKQGEDIKDLKTAAWYKQAFDVRGLGKFTKQAATKAPKALFNLHVKNNVKTIHNRHLKPTLTLEDNDKSEGLAPAANPRPATLPRINPNKEATSNKGLSTMAPPPQDENVGVMCAAGGR